MVVNYEEIVNKWYVKLREPFLRRITYEFRGRLSLDDAENIYQDTILAVHQNLIDGRVKEDTSWSSYIMTIGFNLANKALRGLGGKTDSIDRDSEEDDDSKSGLARKVEQILADIPDEDDVPFNQNPDVKSALADAIIRTHEPCATIIRLFYYDDVTMDEIAEEVRLKGYACKDASVAKAKKSQCMNSLIKYLQEGLRRLGVIDSNQVIVRKGKGGKHIITNSENEK